MRIICFSRFFSSLNQYVCYFARHGFILLLRPCFCKLIFRDWKNDVGMKIYRELYKLSLALRFFSSTTVVFIWKFCYFCDAPKYYLLVSFTKFINNGFKKYQQKCFIGKTPRVESLCRLMLFEFCNKNNRKNLKKGGKSCLKMHEREKPLVSKKYW